MFPSSPNLNIKLLKLVNSPDSIGVRKYKCISFKDVIGIAKSITAKEHYESRVNNYRVDLSVKIHSFIYDGSKYAYINNLIYKIERTYITGSFIELYFSETDLSEDDIDDFPDWYD